MALVKVLEAAASDTHGSFSLALAESGIDAGGPKMVSEEQLWSV